MEHSDPSDGRRGGAVPGLLQAAAMDTGWWPCRECTLETDRTLVCHDKCPRYAMHRALIWAGKPGKGDRAAAEVTLEGKLRSIRHRGTGKVAQR